MNGISCAAALLAFSAAPVFAQIDPLYYTDYNSQTLHLVQFGADTPYPMPGGSVDAISIAVAGDVRTVGGLSDPTRQYNLACTYTGPSYARPSMSPQLLDGTTDGKFNYAMASDNWLYRFDRDWQSPTPLFQPAHNGWGVTYDDINKSFWITNGTGTAEEYSMTGVGPLSSFSLNPGTFPENAIAWERTTDSLWVIDNFGGTTAQQYDKFGTPMQSVALVGGIGREGGAEFETGLVPAPGSLGVLGLAVCGAARRRRRVK